MGDRAVFVKVFEACKTFAESQFDIVHRAATVLGYNKFGQVANVAAVGVGIAMQVVLGAVYEAYNVGILFDGAGFAEVAQLRSLAVRTVFDATVELRQRYYGYIEFLGQLLERARYHTDFLFARTEFHSGGVHQLQVVDDNHLDLVLADKAASLGAQFEDTQ